MKTNYGPFPMVTSGGTIAHPIRVEIAWQKTMFWVEVTPAAKTGYAQLSQDLIVQQEAISI